MCGVKYVNMLYIMIIFLKEDIHMSKSIKKSVLIRVVASICSTLLCCAVVNVGMTQIKKVDLENEQSTELLKSIQSAEIAHYKWCNSLSQAVYAGKEFTGSSDPTVCSLGGWIYNSDNLTDKTIISLRDEIEPIHKELHGYAEETINLIKTNPAKAKQFYEQTVQTTVGNLITKLDKIIEKSEENATVSGQKMNNVINIVAVLSTIFFIISIACLVMLIAYVIKNIILPILKLTEESKPIANGDLKIKFSYKSHDEIGSLVDTLTKSMHLIQSYIADITRVTDELASGNFDVKTSERYVGDFSEIEHSVDKLTKSLSYALSQIAIASSSVSDNAEQMSNTAQMLAQGAITQSEAVDELRSRLDKMAIDARENAKMAISAQSDTEKTSEQLAKSDKDMQAMVAAMNDISNASSSIGDIIKTIEAIAFQTNILALNAAVEAARAGTAGKGFAVVANEVRSLASQSDHAAKATKELIENSIAAVERGNTIVSNVSDVLKKTLEFSKHSAEGMVKITKAVQGESEIIEKTAEGINQIAEVVHTNSATSEETAAISQQMFAQSQQLQNHTKTFNLRKDMVTD